MHGHGGVDAARAGGLGWMLALWCLCVPQARAADSALPGPARRPAPAAAPVQASVTTPVGAKPVAPSTHPASGRFPSNAIEEAFVEVPQATRDFFGRLVVPGEGQFQPRSTEGEFEVQLALARRRFSPGSLDGIVGPQTRAALEAFQALHGLAPSGVLDEPTRRVLLLDGPPLARIVVRQEDVDQLRAGQETWLGRSQADYMGYTSLLEKVAELSQSHPRLIRQLNGETDWQGVRAGAVLTVPNAALGSPVERAASIRISLGARRLQVFGEGTNLLAHFPCSIGSVARQRPVGRLEVAVIAENPNYTFDPEVFPESEEGRRLGRKLIVPPGPNNPVGVAWIGLSQPGYGIHGTPEPEKVGRTESHGCFRLANWNAAQLVGMVWVSMPVWVEP